LVITRVDTTHVGRWMKITAKAAGATLTFYAVADTSVIANP